MPEELDGVHFLTDAGSGPAIVFLHPAPGSGAFDPDPQVTGSRDVVLVGIDRPGYGSSKPPRAHGLPSIESLTDDVSLKIERAGLGRVGIVGWDVGGMVAASLAARRPKLVDRLAMVGTPVPQGEIPWLPSHLGEALGIYQKAKSRTAFEDLVKFLAKLVPGDLRSREALGLLHRSGRDDAFLRDGGAMARLGDMLTSAFAQGAVGYARDLAAASNPRWGFDLKDVRSKTLLLFGSKDPLCASRHGTWWQRNLPDARLEMVPGAGHLLILPMWDRILSHLAPGTKRHHGSGGARG